MSIWHHLQVAYLATFVVINHYMPCMDNPYHAGHPAVYYYECTQLIIHLVATAIKLECDKNLNTP